VGGRRATDTVPKATRGWDNAKKVNGRKRVTSVSSSSGPRGTASSTAIQEVRPGSKAAIIEYGQPGIICG
jgi:hypothetical protein